MALVVLLQECTYPIWPSYRIKFKIKAIVNRTGQKAKAVAEQYSADYATTDIQDVLNDEAIDLVMITTRHESHGT